MIAPTEHAVEVVVQAQSAARRFDPEAHIRLVRDGSAVRFELADGPQPDDTQVPCGAVILWAEAGLEGTLDAGEHNAPLLIPSRS